MMFNYEINIPQMLITVKKETDTLGYVAIDSPFGGRSHGGLRMQPDVDVEEISSLARSMTLKYGFLGLPHGGAKAGIRYEPEAPQEARKERLKEFGRAIAPLILNGVYFPAPDMGTSNDDIRFMLKSIGAPIKRRELLDIPSGYYTALSVFTAAKTTADFLNLELSNCSVAIEGFGKVGGELANLFARANTRIVAVSTSKGAIFNPKGLDIKRLKTLSREAGSHMVTLYKDAEQIKNSELLELPVDILCPCARHNTIRADNADKIMARFICSGANNPVTYEADELLFRKGILCLPDFVTNCGGVLGGTMEFASVDRKTISDFIEKQIGIRILWLLKRAREENLLPRDIALHLTLKNLERIRKQVNNSRLYKRFFEAGLELYRRGWIPGSIVARLSLGYFESSIVSPEDLWYKEIKIG